MSLARLNKVKKYYGDRLILDRDKLEIFDRDRIGLVGINGAGKTTLLRNIISKKEGIKVLDNVVIGYFDQSQKILDSNKTILENILKDCSYDESFIMINLDGFGFKGDTVFKKVSLLSGGEKVKIALCKILLSDNNLLILDEPTNYLDIKSMESLETALINCNKTLLIVSHDRRFISNICDYIIEIKIHQLSWWYFLSPIRACYLRCVLRRLNWSASRILLYLLPLKGSIYSFILI
ncbi:ATP-binding cassette domain-containing protein [Clostridium sp. B9]|uniref:ATP-binding cassette domain-containing protein n=1 Tax=Clostridium sp. B9 TaxID=3423224 RepID=UPI003D2F0732